MNLTLIPCFLSPSTDTCDKKERYKDLTFKNLKQDLNINIDGTYPESFLGNEISSQHDFFEPLFTEIQKKATDWYINFFQTHGIETVQNDRPKDTLTNQWFHLEIRENHGGVYAILWDSLSCLRAMRFVFILKP
jgi:hypothetical protein